jgi:hypothetical protein
LRRAILFHNSSTVRSWVVDKDCVISSIACSTEGACRVIVGTSPDPAADILATANDTWFNVIALFRLAINVTAQLFGIDYELRAGETLTVSSNAETWTTLYIDVPDTVK